MFFDQWTIKLIRYYLKYRKIKKKDNKYDIDKKYRDSDNNYSNNNKKREKKMLK